jgi:hypothetical protein
MDGISANTDEGIIIQGAHEALLFVPAGTQPGVPDFEKRSRERLGSARRCGGFEVEMDWQDGTITQARLSEADFLLGWRHWPLELPQRQPQPRLISTKAPHRVTCIIPKTAHDRHHP